MRKPVAITGAHRDTFRLKGGIERHSLGFWCTMMPRELFARIGVFDEVFSTGLVEDTDFCIRAMLAGYRFKRVNNIPIKHRGHQTFKTLPTGNNRSEELYVRNMSILNSKYTEEQLVNCTARGEPFDFNTDNPIRFSIVIPTYNRCNDLLKPCVESLLQYTDLSEVEVIVVANGCTDNTVEFINSFSGPFKLIVDDQPLGFPKAANLGIEQATGEHVVLLNNDTVLTKQRPSTWLYRLRSALYGSR